MAFLLILKVPDIHILKIFKKCVQNDIFLPINSEGRMAQFMSLIAAARHAQENFLKVWTKRSFFDS